MVGQTSAGVKNYVEVGSWGVGTLANIDVGDVVSIHMSRTSGMGISNGVNFLEGTLHNRRVVAKSAGPDRLVFDKPILSDMNTDLGAGVYAYITKARNIHASIFVGGVNGIVSGVALPPRFHAPPPVDDFDMVQRFSWDGYMGYQTYDPNVFEVVFSAGSTRVKGPAEVQ
jgi:hypothetical protein